MTDFLTVNPDALGLATAIAADAQTFLWSPGGPLKRVAVAQLLSKLIATDLVKASRAALTADLDWDADTVALVHNDPTAAYNGWYRKTGASGAGAWVQFEQLTAAIRSEIIAARDDAVDANTSAQTALAAILTAAAAGNIFGTKAAATAAIAGIAADAYVQVLVDESQGDEWTIYQKVGGAYTFVKTLSAAPAVSGGSGITIGVLHDGVLFDTARGDSFTDLWDIPVDATLTASATSIAFNSPAPKALKMKLKDDLGGVYSGCYEYWRFTARFKVTEFFAAGDAGIYVGFLADTPTFMSAQLGAHGGAVGKTLVTRWNASSNLGSAFDTDGVTGGFTIDPDNEIEVVCERIGDQARWSVQYPGEALRESTQVLHRAPADNHELPRVFSTPYIEFVKGHLECTYAKVEVILPGTDWIALCGTSITGSSFATNYGEGYAQLVRTAHAGKVLVCGAPSATSQMWIDNLPEVLALGPRAVVFEPFANDFGPLSVETIEDHATTLASICEAAGVPFAFINGLPQTNINVPTLNAWLSAQGWNVIDGYAALVGVGTAMNAAYAADAVHPNSTGMDALRDVVDPGIDSFGFFNLTSAYLIDTDPTLAGNSNTRLAPQKAVKAYADAAKLAAQNYASAAILAKGSHVPYVPASGAVIINTLAGNGDTPAAIPYAADRVDVALFHPANSFTVTSLEIDVQTAAVAGKRARIAIYADNAGSPGALIASSGHLAVDATGVKTWTPAGGQAFVANTRYWLGVHVEDAVTLMTVPTRSCRAIGYDKAGRGHLICHRQTASYATGQPAAGAGVATFANAPMIVMTVA